MLPIPVTLQCFAIHLNSIRVVFARLAQGTLVGDKSSISWSATSTAMTLTQTIQSTKKRIAANLSLE